MEQSLKHPKRDFTNLPHIKFNVFELVWNTSNSKKEDGWFKYVYSSQEIYVNITKGKLHSINDEPSVVHSDNSVLEWHHYGAYHRIGGPARITNSSISLFTTGFISLSNLKFVTKRYYIYGEEYSLEEYQKHPLIIAHNLYSITHL